MAVSSKRRNSEKRKEKSRDAARCRRGKEAEIFTELASQLPLPMSTIDSLDKASVMRLLLSTFKVRSVMKKRMKLEMPEEGTLEAKLDTFYPKALDGFLIILSKEGDMIYVSESVSKLLGLQQIDLMGQSIFEYAHPCDHDDIQEVLSPRQDDEEEASRMIFVRLKCTLTSKGRNVNLKSASYKVIKLSGRYIPDTTVDTELSEMETEMCMDIDEDDTDMDDDDDDRRRRVYRPRPLPHFLAVAESIHHPSNIEVPLDRRTFTSRHNMSMKFTDCDDRIKRLIGFNSEELVGQSFFGFHHATDSKMMEKAFRDLFSKGQTCTGQYRFLAKNGGYVWMVTEATVIFNNKSQKPECVVCVHYVLSHVEQHGRILASVQNGISTGPKHEDRSPISTVTKKEEPTRHLTCNVKAKQRREVKVSEIFHVPTFSTETVFDDKPEDMDEDYYFPPGVSRTIGSSNQLNLAHLAPQDGDVCIPLPVPSMDKVLKVESYGTNMNLYDDFASIEQQTEMNDMSLYTEMKDKRSMASPVAMSPDSSTTHSNVPSPSCYLSTINQSDIKSSEEKKPFTEMSNDSIDFTMRAPFIPMSPEEDFVLSRPTSDNFLDMGADFNPGIFGSTEDVFCLKDELYEGPPQERKSKTTIEMLGGSTVQKSIDRPQDKVMMKMKRQLDRSCLEKGPPAAKVSKFLPPAALAPRNGVTVAPESKKDNSSVLMNLLLTGKDVNNGYSVIHKNNISQSKGPGFLQHLLTAVTSHDVEVNAPTNSGPLVQGHDIFIALNRK